jgi:hypothetical protein
MRRSWTLATLAGLTVLTLGTLAFVHTQGEAATQEMQEAAASASREQPIAFPHNIHAGENRIDCAYCHFSAERSTSAGIPPVASCVGCHTVVPGRNNPEEVQKVLGYWERGEPIPWVRIYKVSEHVRFPHMRHIAAEINCTVCHGEVQEMGVITEMAQPLSMGWCVDCHVEQGASRDCTVCHY